MARFSPLLSLLVLTTLAGAFLLWCGPSLDQVVAGASDPQGYVERFGADRSVMLLAAVALWVILGWLWVGLVVTVAGAAPGAVGAVARYVADRVTPAVLRRTVGMAVGIGVATSVPAYAAGPVGDGAPSGGSGVVVTATTDQSSAAAGQFGDTSLEVVSTFDRRPKGDPDPGVDWTTPTQPTAAAPDAGSVTVVAGDCLWDIVAARLDPTASATQIAAAVVRWWKANESVIGDDPNLLLPGQVLSAPAG